MRTPLPRLEPQPSFDRAEDAWVTVESCQVGISPWEIDRRGYADVCIHIGRAVLHLSETEARNFANHLSAAADFAAKCEAGEREKDEFFAEQVMDSRIEPPRRRPPFGSPPGAEWGSTAGPLPRREGDTHDCPVQY